MDLTKTEDSEGKMYKFVFLSFGFVIFLLGVIFHLIMSREISASSYVLLSDMKKLDKNYSKIITTSMKDGKITQYEFNNIYLTVEKIKKEEIKLNFMQNKEEIINYLKSS